MTKYESTVKKIYFPVESVYARLSDLTNLQVIQDRIDDPAFEQLMLEKAGDKVKPEQVAQIKERIRSLQFTQDTVSGDAAPLGTVTLRIVEREMPKLVKFALEGAPIQANLWIQLLPASATQCAMKVTLGAEMNFFIKQMVGKKLEKGVEGLADMLAMIPYGY